MNRSGFTLAEVVVGTAVFLIVALGAYNAFVGLIKLANASQSRILAVQLADEQFEIIRNMRYVDVGLTNGIPTGVLPQHQTVIRGGFTFDVALVIRNVNLATSTLQASSKLVEIGIDCASCDSFTPVALTGAVAPANLQSAASGGALVVQVFDSTGAPIQGATVVVQSTATSSITNTDTTNNEGLLQIIGVPPGVSSYRVTVSKDGYTEARTYPLGGGGNPDPTTPDATIAEGQVTQVSLSIDRVSSLRVESVSPLCAAVPSFDIDVAGTKEVGPGIPNYSESLSTGPAGILDLSPLEWDTYSISPADASHDVAGITPSSPITLNAGNAQNVQLVVVPSNPRSLLVSVVDSVTKLPLSDAVVSLVVDGVAVTKTTGQGHVSQTDWSGGQGQTDFALPDRYFYSDGNIDVSTSTGSIVMSSPFGEYSTIATGTLESSTFDMGTTSNFYSLDWNPIGQPQLAGVWPVKFQFATNPTSTSTPWNYVGPDGTSGSYFTAPGVQISSANDGMRFARYAAYLSTQTATVTPTVSDVSFTYTSGCTPPGQVLFQGLSASSHSLTVTKAGYAPASATVGTSAAWQSEVIEMGL